MTSKLKRELRHAVARREFALHYQPKFRLDSGALEGVEALLRWRTRSGAWVPPVAFTPMLEQMGLIEDVGRWIFERAAADCEYWRSRGCGMPRVAINVSPLQLRDGAALASILSICTAWAVHGTGLDIELTESALMPHSKDLLSVLDALSAGNVIIALDDFGCGYSSLNLLARLPVQQLKIDGSFIAQLAVNPRAGLIVAAVIKLARDLGMETIAEGVETFEQLRTLRSLGCGIVQGFLFSPPVSREDVLPLFLQPANPMLRAARSGRISS